MTGIFLRAALALAVMAHAGAVEQRGVVRYEGRVVPGASVTACQPGGVVRIATITDVDGTYRLAGLTEGAWLVAVEMPFFAKAEQAVVIRPNGEPPALVWNLAVLGEAELKALVAARPVKVTPTAHPRVESRPDASADGSGQDPMDPVQAELRDQTAESLLILGSARNADVTVKAQDASFGGHRQGAQRRYHGELTALLNHSALDARPYSLTGRTAAKPAYSQPAGAILLSGPVLVPSTRVRIPPTFTVRWEWIRRSTVQSQGALVPDDLLRGGDFSARRGTVTDPASGQPFPGNVLPGSRLSRAAVALLALYPHPQPGTASQYNYETPVMSGHHEHRFEAAVSQRINRYHAAGVRVSRQQAKSSSTSVFGFLDVEQQVQQENRVWWNHRCAERCFAALSFRLQRSHQRLTPFFAGREDISGVAGIQGSDRQSDNWGPPSLSFSSGLTSLSGANAFRDVRQTEGAAYTASWRTGAHGIRAGAGYERVALNRLGQPDARGAFRFTGESTGSDFASYLLGIADAVSVAAGNADKYGRSTGAHLYITDDWRPAAGLSVHVGLRWEYVSPMREKYGRMANLDVSTDFARAVPSRVLPYPDFGNLAPRVALAWRPSTRGLLFRAGYGAYFDAGMYEAIALQMMQQPPYSRNLQVRSEPGAPLILETALLGTQGGTSLPRFGVGPGVQRPLAQIWSLSVEQELAGPWVVTGLYNGTRGSRLQQQILPNTTPPGAAVASTPLGFAYLGSNGYSTVNSARVELRRRMQRGVQMQAAYRYAKAIDDARPAAVAGAALLAQDWRNPRGERGPSDFDQRHELSVRAQLGFGTRRLGAGWTAASELMAGSGSPLSPSWIAVLPGTGISATLRPDLTGQPVRLTGGAPNAAAFAAPAPGHWGNAGRNSIGGPARFSLNTSLGRAFDMPMGMRSEFRIDAVNPLNHPVLRSWFTTVNSLQFGQPASVNGMRSLTVSLRVSY